jgi:hypothetical protein
MRTSISVLVAIVCTGCVPAVAQKPVQFTARTTEDPVDVVGRALAASGQTVANADHALKLVQTRWENTGFGYGFVNVAVPYPHSVGAIIWRRYAVVVVSRGERTDFTLRAETQRCAEGARTVDGFNVLGDCTTLWADGLVPDHQEQLEALGAQLRRALGGTQVEVAGAAGGP